MSFCAEKGSMLGRHNKSSKQMQNQLTHTKKNYQELHGKQVAEVQSSVCPKKARKAVDK